MPPSSSSISSSFYTGRLTYLISLPPSSLASGSLKPSIVSSLSSNLLRYDPRIPGVLCGYTNIDFENNDSIGRIVNENSWINFRVVCSATIFLPKEGDVLTGTINKLSSGHIGVLIYGTFNGSIPSSSLEARNLNYSEERTSWFDDCDKEYKNGEQVTLKVTKVRWLEGVISVEGSFEGSGPTTDK